MYYCNNCQKSFPYQSKLDRHMNTCSGFDNHCQEVINVYSGSIEYYCTLCGKQYKTKPSFYNHIRFYHKQPTNEMITPPLHATTTNIQQIQNQQNINIDKQQNIHITNHVYPNTTVDEKKAIVHPFGQENIRYLDPEVMVQLLESEHLKKAIPYLVKEVHINDDHPENMNIIFPNKKEKFFKVKMDDTTWVYKNKEDVFQMLIDSKNKILIEFFEMYKDQLDTDLTKNYQYLQKYMLKYDKDYMKYVRENIVRFILTHKDFMEKVAKEDQEQIKKIQAQNHQKWIENNTSS